MIPAIAPLYQIAKLNARLFLNALDGFTEKTAAMRPSKTNNSAIFIACHLLDARYYLTNHLGRPAKCPYQEIFDNINSIEASAEYPPLSGITNSWTEISDILLEVLNDLNEEDALANSTVSFPVDDRTILGGLAFLLEHESYHIGQLGFLRKFLGLPAMKYS